VHIAALAVMALVFGVFATAPAAGQGYPCSECGPGDHWVDTCLEGEDQIANTQALVGIDLDLDCVADLNLVLGPCGEPDHLLIISRSDPRDDSQNFPGLRPVDGHLDVIDTEIISMCLTGGGFTLRAGMGQGGVISPALGAIVELVAHSERAESFFDVFFVVETPMGSLYNQTPVRVEAIIECVPPQAKYIKPTGCYPLYTSPIPGQGMHVANLVEAEHIVNPVPSHSQLGLILLILAVAGFFGFMIIRKRRAIIGAR
jgi:hypothetical protein